MQYLETEMSETFINIFQSVFSWELVKVPGEMGRAYADERVAASVQILGAWNGALALQIGKSLGRQAAAVMFSLEEAQITPDLVEDALGELVNMGAGKIKSLLPGPTSLSMPTVVGGQDYRIALPKSTLLTFIRFECQTKPVAIGLLQKESHP